MTCEERVLSIEGYRPDGPLDGVVVDLDAPVGQEELQGGNQQPGPATLSRGLRRYYEIKYGARISAGIV
ncbi:hypothetical protein D9M69_733290 [compost metagenome]